MAVVESVFGRFRPRSAEIQLEDLVAVVADSEAAKWFSAEGRAFRNDMAHGRWRATNEPRTVDAENLLLTSIARSLLLDLIRFATSADDLGDDVIARFRFDVEQRTA